MCEIQIICHGAFRKKEAGGPVGKSCLGRVIQYITMYKKNTYKWIKHIDFIMLDTAVLLLSFVGAYLIRHEGSSPFAKSEYLTLGQSR